MRTNVGASIQIVLIAAATSLWSMPVLAQAPARLSDKDVKTLLEQVDEGRDKFEGNLDGTFLPADVDIGDLGHSFSLLVQAKDLIGIVVSASFSGATTAPAAISLRPII